MERHKIVHILKYLINYLSWKSILVPSNIGNTKITFQYGTKGQK